jgi:uncharacterized protein (TIGR01777 family)
MRIVIIGGRGFIGRHLSNELKAGGHQVVVTTRDRELTSAGADGYAYWDGRDESGLAAIIEKCDVVINLAGENIGASRWTNARKEALMNSRVETATMLAAALKTVKHKPSVVIQASAVGYYGIGDQPRDETSPAGDDWLAQLSVEWEKSISRLEAKDIRVVVTRSGVVLGKSGSVLQRLMLPIRLFAGGPLGSGTQWISWIHIKDEVKALQFLIENGNCRGVYNLTSPEPVQNKEMEKKLAALMHRPDWIATPSFLLRILLGEMSTIVLDGQKVLPKRLLEAGFIFKFGNLDEALKDLL